MWVVFCGKIVVGIAASLKFEQAVQKKDQREIWYSWKFWYRNNERYNL